MKVILRDGLANLVRVRPPDDEFPVYLGIPVNPKVRHFSFYPSSHYLSNENARVACDRQVEYMLRKSYEAAGERYPE